MELNEPHLSLEHILSIDVLPKYIGYVITIFCLLQLFIFFFINRKHIAVDLRGRDLTWQFLELSAVVWLVLFPAAVVSEVFSNSLGSAAWSSLDAVYFMNVGGKLGMKYLENQSDKTLISNDRAIKKESTSVITNTDSTTIK